MTLKELNLLNKKDGVLAFFNCCGSSSWAREMLKKRPFTSELTLEDEAAIVFQNSNEEDWLEAFSHHPRLGDRKNLEDKFAATKHWAGEEQSATSEASESTLAKLEQANLDYEKKFGFTFILCATGKSASFMLHSIYNRLPNTRKVELSIAMEEQNKITKLRLKKLLS